MEMGKRKKKLENHKLGFQVMCLFDFIVSLIHFIRLFRTFHKSEWIFTSDAFELLYN